jgi:hypothetical protein
MSLWLPSGQWEVEPVSGRMNWDRVNRENRVVREAKRGATSIWAPEPRSGSSRAKTTSGVRNRRCVRCGNTAQSGRDHCRPCARARVAATEPVAARVDTNFAAYRDAHTKVRRELFQLVESSLLMPLPAAQVPKPKDVEIQMMRRTAEALNNLIAEYRRYWL